MAHKIMIEWIFPVDKSYIGTCYEQYMGKDFKSEVLGISDDEIPDYYVCTEYGQDMIPSNKCKIIQ